MSEKFRPVTAITMGDPAGIGPEIVVGAMLVQKRLHECCKPFVIGSHGNHGKSCKGSWKRIKIQQDR